MTCLAAHGWGIGCFSCMCYPYYYPPFFPKGGLHRHSMDAGHLCSAMVQLRAWAQAGGEFSASGSGHGTAGASARVAVWAHGIIMIVGWIVLLPAGGCMGAW